MRRSRKLLELSALLLLSALQLGYVACDDGAGDDAAGDDAAGDDAGGDDAGGDDAGGDEGDDGNNYDGGYYDDFSWADAQSDGIEYWTDYAILPQKCIVYNDQDVIVFSIYEQAYKQCVNEPMGTYYTDVPRFLGSYLDQLEDNAANEGVDYEVPDAGQFVECTQMVVDNQEYWVQLGCSDDTSQEIVVNIYSDNTCTTRSYDDQGYDDSGIDVSGLNFKFNSCQGCVVWFDLDEDDIDDQYYVNHKNDAPLCTSVWAYKQDCDKTCQKMGRVRVVREGWIGSDKMLLTALYAFGALMVFGIFRMTSTIEKDNKLVEDEAPAEAKSPAQKYGVYAVAGVMFVVAAILAFMKLKNATWFLLFVANLILFTYLMRLTFDSGCKACGTAGHGVDDDSSDEEEEDDEEEKDDQARTGHTPPDVPATPPNLPQIT